MARGPRTTVTVEEYVERRTESAAGRTIERHYRRARWEPEPVRPAVLEVVETAAPLLRAVAIAMAPVVGRLALRALAPRVRAALPAPPRPRVRILAGRATPLPLPAPVALRRPPRAE